MGISFLIVNYNGEDYLDELVASIGSNREIQKIDHEILFYDNNSSDGSVALIERLTLRYKNIRLYTDYENVGFSRANNILAKRAYFEHLCFINNDTKIINVDCLIHSLKSDLVNSHVFTCKILNRDGSKQRNIFSYPALHRLVVDLFLIKSILPRRLFSKIANNDSADNTVLRGKYCSGCFFVTTKDLFSQVGGFDEDFFFYHEEADLFLRFNKVGVNILYLASDEIIHYGGGGGEISPFSFSHYYVNLFKLFNKHKIINSYFLKLIFKLSFRLRILLLRLRIPVKYSPFGTLYRPWITSEYDFNKAIGMHKEVLEKVIQLTNKTRTSR